MTGSIQADQILFSRHHSGFKRFYYLSVIFVLLINLSAFSVVAEARPAIYDVLEKGSRWTLNVNGEQGELTLLGGKTGQTPGGGYKLDFQVQWRGSKGTIQGASNRKNSMQAVTLKVIRKNGIQASCRGYIAQETDSFMAGQCGNKISPGAWYATRSNSTKPVNTNTNEPIYKQKLLRCRQDSEAKQNKLVDTYNLLNRCKVDKQLLIKKGTGPSNKSLSEFQYLLSPGQGGKTDDVQGITFPQSPKQNTQTAIWLSRNNAGLLKSISLGFKGKEFQKYKKLESSECQNIFCQMEMRQQTLYFLLGGR